MGAWSNIEVPPGDAEIASIDMLEEALGNYPDHIRQIRDLITRFEACHFKYQRHLKNIKQSIKDLHPCTDPAGIGRHHLQHGDQAWRSDKTGRTFMGQQYLWALHNWLDNNEEIKPPEYNEQLAREVGAWLGERSPEKEKLIRMLLARLTWDWKTLEDLSQRSMEEISRQGDDGTLEYQIYRMDICHFAFPLHLINILRGIGKMRPVQNFEGCGTHNSNIRKSIHEELAKINHRLKSMEKVLIERQDQEELTRIWLFACLAKTIKEQAGLADTIAIPG